MPQLIHSADLTRLQWQPVTNELSGTGPGGGTKGLRVNWEAIGAIGEVAGAIGVIATLLYLAVQIRQNTRAMTGATQDAITERKQFELRWSSDIGSAMRKSFESPENLTDDETWQVNEWMT